MRPDARFIDVDGLQTRVQDMGTGRALILVHGLGGPLMWQRVIEPLAETFHVYVIDLPGWGESMAPTRRYSTEDYATHLARTAATLGIGRASYVGISYGGQIAARLAEIMPVCVDKLVLICCTGLSRTSKLLGKTSIRRPLSFIIRHMVLRSSGILCWLARRSFYDISRRPDGLCEDFYRQLSRPGGRESWVNGLGQIYRKDEVFIRELSEISTPTLIVWGENDRTVPVSSAELFRQRIPDSSIRMFPQCAHSVPLEVPAELCDAIVQFHQH